MFTAVWMAAVWLGASDVSLEACDDRASECRESCSMEFGTDPNLRIRLGDCLMDCKQRLKDCRTDVASALPLPKPAVEPDAGTPDRSAHKRHKSNRNGP